MSLKKFWKYWAEFRHIPCKNCFWGAWPDEWEFLLLVGDLTGDLAGDLLAGDFDIGEVERGVHWGGVKIVGDFMTFFEVKSASSSSNSSTSKTTLALWLLQSWISTVGRSLDLVFWLLFAAITSEVAEVAAKEAASPVTYIRRPLLLSIHSFSSN